MYDPGQTKGFALKVAISGPHLTNLNFYKRNAITREDLPYGRVPGASCSDGKTFFVIFGRKMLRNVPKCQEPRVMQIRPCNNMVSRRDQLMHHVSLTIHLHLAGFIRQNAFEKKISPDKNSLNKLLNLN